MSQPLKTRLEGRTGRRLLLPPPGTTGTVLMEAHHICQVTVVLPLPGDGQLLSPASLTERVVTITALMKEILSRAEAVPHGGINE